MKKQFLERLAHYLDVLNEEERKEILSFYEERFNTGVRYEGKTEAEIIDELESPKQIARHVLEEYGFDSNRLLAAQKVEKKESGVGSIIGIILFDIFLVAIIVGALSGLTVALAGGLLTYITRLLTNFSFDAGIGVLPFLGGLGLAFLWLLLVLALYDVFIGFIAWLVRWHAEVFKIGNPRHIYRSIRRLRFYELVRKTPSLQRARSIATLLALVFLVLGSVVSIVRIGALPGFNERMDIETYVYDYDMSDAINDGETWSIEGVLEIGRVRIISTSTDTLVIRSEERDDTPLEIDYDEGTQTIRFENTYERFFFFNIFGSFQLPEVIIEVPEDLLMDDIIVETTNGSIQLNGLDLETIDLQTSNGTVIIEDVIAETINVKSTNGKLTAESFETQSLTMETSNGAIELLDGIAIDVNLKTSNGAIKIEMLNEEAKNGATLVARTSNGKIALDDVYTRDVSLRTSNGDIDYHNNDLTFILDHLEMRTSNGDKSQNVPVQP